MNIDNLWSAEPVRIADADTERETIARAKLGDQDATLTLARAYLPAMRSAVAKYGSTMELDDARQAAFLGLLNAIAAFDADRGGRLATIVRQHVTDALASAAGESGHGFTVPERTLKRFFGILARVDGDVVKAAEIAPDFEMTTETFYGVLQAVRATGSLEAALEADGDVIASGIGPVVADREYADAEDRMLVDMAFRAVDETEAEVCRMAYGFGEYYNPLPDAEIGSRLGMGRVKTLRTRQRALRKMRSALGA